ncbi:unnamed protein product [Caenorhabditis sp. 36 PRJEB53466]|nr:unnamed protein product [Caenorhabditis sp. 36 PRJEB53466]
MSSPSKTPTPLPGQSSSLYVPSETDNLNLDPWNLSADQLYGCAHLLHDQANFDPTANSEPLDEQMDFEPNLLVDDYPYKLAENIRNSVATIQQVRNWKNRIVKDYAAQTKRRTDQLNDHKGIFTKHLKNMKNFIVLHANIYLSFLPDEVQQSVYSDSLLFDDSDVEEDIAFWRRNVETNPTFQFVANKARTFRNSGIWQMVLDTMEMEIPIITTCRRLVLLHQKKRAVGKEYAEYLKHLQPQIYGTGELTDEICAAISYFEISLPPFVS